MFNFYFPPAPSSTPWAPAWSPDGGQIAFGMSGSIWTVDLDSGIAHERTYNKKYHSSPDWSPDGKWIIYTADDGGQTIQLEILDVATGETHTLTEDAFIYTDPVFSPDGHHVAYVSTKPNGYFNVYIRPIKEGRWAGEEIPVSRDNSFGRDRLYFGPWDMHITPAWMPDGKELLIVSNRDVPLGSGNVLRVPAKANGMEEAETVLVEQTLYRTQPDVSVDGKRFVYSSTRGAADQFNNLYVQPTRGGEPYKLTFFSHDAFHPRWSPDGEWIAYISNKEGLPQLALLETYGGEQRTLRIKERRWRRPVGTLSLNTVDAENNQEVGARIHLIAPDGKFYAPSDTYCRIGREGGDHAFHNPGSCEVTLPAGKTNLTVVKGFEFWPETLEVEIKPNETAEITVALKRMTDMSDQGWFSGSTHVHLNYGGNLHNTLENLMMMSEAEDQDIVNMLVANKDNRILDYQFFVKGGKPHPTSEPDHLLVVGEEYRPPFYGHAIMLGLEDHLISPFTTGYEGTAIESLYPSNTNMFRKAKAQGAFVGYAHANDGDKDPLEGDLGYAKGFIVDAALGTTDAIEWWAAERASFFPLYAVWNNEIKVTAVGGEDSISDLHRTKLIGTHRTYVYTGNQGLTMDGWFKALRSGHAFVSNGPLIELEISGKMPGEAIELPMSGGTIDIGAKIRSIVPLEKAMLIFNGKVVEEIPLDEGRMKADFKKTIRVDKSGWYHLRAEGNPSERFPLDAGYAQAFTNPVWVTVGNQPVRSRQAAEYCLRWIDKLQKMAEEWPDWRSQKEMDHVFAQFEEARTIFRRFIDQAVRIADGQSN